MDARRRALIAGSGALVATASRGRAAPRLAVALGSGSMHGLAHIGVVQALERASLVPDLIVGSSVGAAVGALWAAGLAADAIRRIADTLDWTTSATWTLPWRGLRRLDGLQRAIDHAVGGRAIEQLPRRFAAVATDLANGRPVVLDRGPLGAAVAASSAIPVLFEPVRLDGRDLVDGSLSAPVPVDAARANGGRVVLAVDVAYRPHEAPAGGISDIGFQAMHILVNRLADEQLQRADLVLRLDLHHLMARPETTAESLIAAGDAAMTRLTPGLLERLRRR